MITRGVLKIVSLALISASLLLFSGCAGKTINAKIESGPEKGVNIKDVSIDGFGFGTSEFQRILNVKISNSKNVRIKDNSRYSLRGRINSSGFNVNRYITSYKTDKGVKYTYHVRKSVTVDVFYELLDRNSNTVLTSDSYKDSYSKSYSSGTSYFQAESNFQPESTILSAIYDTLAEEVAKDISVQDVDVKISLMEEECGVDLGITYAENERVQQAISIWEQTIKNRSCTLEQKVAARYNIGAVYEARAEYMKAFENYKAANALDPENEDIIKSLTRVERRYQEQQRAKEYTK